ncbi:hypothetical protein Tco_0255996, partial [Tanacetum coccineum]
MSCHRWQRFSEYQDNIQGYVSAAAVNYNQGNTGYRPQSVANQIRPPGFAQPNVKIIKPGTIKVIIKTEEIIKEIRIIKLRFSKLKLLLGTDIKKRTKIKTKPDKAEHENGMSARKRIQ